MMGGSSAGPGLGLGVPPRGGSSGSLNSMGTQAAPRPTATSFPPQQGKAAYDPFNDLTGLGASAAGTKGRR